MKLNIYFISFILNVLCLLACTRRQTIPWNEHIVDSLMECAPDEALYILEQCDRECVSADEAVRIRHALLKTKAADLAYLPHTSVHPMQEVADYYEKHGTQGERIEACYYMGSVYRDLRDIPRALEWYLKARKAADGITSENDFKTLRRIYSQLATLYTLQRDYKKALEVGKLAYAIEKEHGGLNAASMQNLAALYWSCNKLDSAHIYYKLSNHLIRGNKSKPDGEILGCVAGSLNFYCRHKEKISFRREFDWCREFMKNYGPAQLPVNACSVKADVFEIEGQTDSAIIYNLKALSDFDSYKDKSAAARHLCELYESKGDQANAFKFAKKVFAYTDSSIATRQEDKFSLLDNEFRYYQDFQQECEREDKYMANRNYLVIVLSLASIAFFFGYVYYRRSRKIHQEVQTIFRAVALREKDVPQRKNNDSSMSISTLMEVRRRFVESAGRHSRLQKELVQALFEAVDNAYPDFYDQIMKAAPSIVPDKLCLCYMLRIGLKQRDIAILFGQSTSNISKRVKSVEAEIGFSPSLADAPQSDAPDCCASNVATSEPTD